jgi:nitrogen regulatory protein P-II 1
MAVVAKTAFTGEVGDGKMFVVAVVDALRVRTRERGLSAL